MHRILLLDPDRDRDAIVRDLRAIEANTRYYYRWENMLFAALTYYMLGDLDNARRLIQVSIDEGYYVPLHEEIRVEMESLAASRKLADTRDTMLQRAERGDLADQAHVGRTSRLDALRALGRQLTDITVSVAPRSRSATNAKFAVPGYNVYLLGRGALKGDLYLDDCVVHLPIAWYETPRKDSGKGHKDDAEVSVSLRVNGVAFRAAKTAFDREKAQVHVLFPRVLDLDDIVKRGKTFRCEVRLQDPDNDIVLFYDARRVTDELRRMRPDLSPDEPYFELVAVESAGERYRLENGLIVPAL